MKYYLETKKGRQITAGYITETSDTDAIERVQADLSNGFDILLQKVSGKKKVTLLEANQSSNE